jgi:hypothetical protein
MAEGGVTRRREFIAVVAGALSWPVDADAQQTGKMPRIGVLNNGTAASVTNSTFFRKRFDDPLVLSMTEACKAGLGSTGW